GTPPHPHGRSPGSRRISGHPPAVSTCDVVCRQGSLILFATELRAIARNSVAKTDPGATSGPTPSGAFGYLGYPGAALGCLVGVSLDLDQLLTGLAGQFFGVLVGGGETGLDSLLGQFASLVEESLDHLL